MIFSNRRRSVIKSEHPNLSITEIAKLLGEEWNMLTQNQKDVYKKKADEEKVEYQLKCETARRQYQQLGGIGAPAVEQSKTKKAATSAPKKADNIDNSSSISLSSVVSVDGGK
jgi:HMG (high mobility group) box